MKKMTQVSAFAAFGLGQIEGNAIQSIGENMKNKEFIKSEMDSIIKIVAVEGGWAWHHRLIEVLKELDDAEEIWFARDYFEKWSKASLRKFEELVLDDDVQIAIENRKNVINNVLTLINTAYLLKK